MIFGYIVEQKSNGINSKHISIYDPAEVKD